MPFNRSTHIWHYYLNAFCFRLFFFQTKQFELIIWWASEWASEWVKERVNQQQTAVHQMRSVNERTEWMNEWCSLHAEQHTEYTYSSGCVYEIQFISSVCSIYTVRRVIHRRRVSSRVIAEILFSINRSRAVCAAHENLCCSQFHLHQI